MMTGLANHRAGEPVLNDECMNFKKKSLKALSRQNCFVIISFIIYHSSFITPLFGQSLYQLKTGKEITLLGVGVGSMGASVLLNRTIDPLTLAEIATLNPADINAFDRSATEHWSEKAGQLSDITLFS